MKTISVAELRQNPTEALIEVEEGETYVVTRYRAPIAKLVPIDQPDVFGVSAVKLIPAKKKGPANLRETLGPRHYTTEQVEAILAEMKDDR